MADGYRDITFSGGQVNASFIPLWLGLVTAGGADARRLAPDDPLGGLAALSTTLGGAADFQIPTHRRQRRDRRRPRLRRPVLEDALAARGRRPDQRPAFVVGGQHDLFQRGEPLVYERLKHRVPPAC